MKGNVQFVVICPGGAATGGVELLHQLVDTLNCHGRKAFILYYPFFKKFDTPDPYKKYNAPIVKFSKNESSSTFYIIPETLTHLVKEFGVKQSIVWWMSVDNYVNSGGFLYSVKNFINPLSYQNVKKQNDLKHIAGNLYQSEYARIFLSAHEVLNTLELGDYINSDYISAAYGIHSCDRENIIVYNPAKGIEKTRALINALPRFNFVPIQNMNRNEVIDLLLKAKIYVDFGNHPGKDRIPREAASLGCVVVTNRKGSAMNPVDIPIAEVYKIDDESEFFVKNSEALISSIFEQFSNHQTAFETYRRSISEEKDRFISSTLELAKRIENTGRVN